MLKRVSIRIRLTILSVLILTLCCFGLTLILNISANTMANVIESIPLTPAISTNELYRRPNVIVAIPSQTSISARKTFFNHSLIYMGFIIILGGVLTYIVAGGGLRPLYNLSKQMKNRTVNNLSEKLQIPPVKDEITDLTYAFNEMSHKLDLAFSMQKQFSQNAAHELRTPLAVIKTKLEVFRKKPLHTQEEYDKLLDVISINTNRLSYLVKVLLELSNTDTLEYSQTIYIKALILEATQELSLLAQEKNISITVTGDEALTVTGNKTLLFRVFYNLIENAIKYNVANGQVTITISAIEQFKPEQCTEIRVCDSGIGIPEELQPLIFEPFFRVDKSRSREMGGAGLGLALVKSILDKHNGTITVENNENNGTCFKITVF